MILFTGSGAIADSFSRLFTCKIVSARSMSDEELQIEIKNATVIIHNAAAINATSLSSFVDANFILTKRIVDIAFLVNPDVRFIYISSMSILLNDTVYKEPEDMTNYAFSKYIAELYCLKHELKNICCVRFSTIFYKDPAKDGLSKLAYEAIKTGKLTIYNDGKAIRDFIPLGIAVQYLYKLATESFLSDKKVNIASAHPHSFNVFSDIILSRFPAISLENIKVPETNILSEFSKKYIENIGEIEFKIEDHFINYLDGLIENSNI